jgi:hypothetical protein
MLYVLLADHTAEVYPMSNSKTREMMQKVGPEIPSIAERTGFTIVAGPYVNNEHLTVAIVEADEAEPVDRFLVESRLAQWNKVRVQPPRITLLPRDRDTVSAFLL